MNVLLSHFLTWTAPTTLALADDWRIPQKLLEEDELRRKFQFKLQSLTVRDVSKSVRPSVYIPSFQSLY